MKYHIEKRRKWAVVDEVGRTVDSFRYRHHAVINAEMRSVMSTVLYLLPVQRLSNRQLIYGYELVEKRLLFGEVRDVVVDRGLVCVAEV